MGNRLLMIIDPQIDFITGSLPVPGAENAMNALAAYLHSTIADYAGIIVTADRHPMRHCSFNTEGGEWPVHCVADSVGAAIWPPIMLELLSVPDKVSILHKGEDRCREEYSIFKNSFATDRIKDVIESDEVGIIDICGLAGDVCVADTISDGIRMDGMPQFNVLTGFSPSIDGGKTLNSLIKKYGLSCDR